MRIMIADGPEPLPQGFASALLIDGIESLTAENFSTALDMVRNEGPVDLLLLDTGLPEMKGLAGLKQTLDQFPGLRVAPMAATISPKLVEEVVGLGAIGCLPKQVAVKSLVQVVRFMASPSV